METSVIRGYRRGEKPVDLTGLVETVGFGKVEKISLIPLMN